MNSIVALPIAAAMPTSSPLLAGGGPDRRAMHAYASWLFMERRILCRELWPHVGTEAERFDWQDNAGAYWHCEGPGSWRDKPQPSSRAAAVLDMAGVDWRNMAGVDWRTPDERYDCGLNHTDTGERPEYPPAWPHVDHELSEASGRLGINGLAKRALFEKFGDAAYDREDYCQIDADFMKCLNVLENVKAKSWNGIWTKAAAIRNADDESAIAAIAKSLASDILEKASVTRESTAA
jgi:hypothetical protein